MDPEEFAIVTMMEHYGGSFAKALATACYRADRPNLDRIKQAFPELWAEYADLARLSSRKEP